MKYVHEKAIKSNLFPENAYFLKLFFSKYFLDDKLTIAKKQVRKLLSTWDALESEKRDFS